MPTVSYTRGTDLSGTLEGAHRNPPGYPPPQLPPYRQTYPTVNSPPIYWSPGLPQPDPGMVKIIAFGGVIVILIIIFSKPAPV